MAFKETLAAAREQRGMTQQDLAEKLYVTRQAVSRWENGETEPSRGHAQAHRGCA